MQKGKVNFLEFAGLLYCFSIAFAASTGHVAIKISRVLLAFSFFLYALKNRKIEIHKEFYTKWLISFFVFCAFSFFWSVSRSNTASALLSMLYVVVCNLILAFILSKSEGDYVYSMMKSSIFGAIAHGLSIFVKNGFDVYFSSRGGAIVENANTLTFVCCFSFIFCFVLLVSNKVERKNLYYFFAFILFIFAFLTTSKKFVLYLGVFFFVYFISSSKNKEKLVNRLLISLAVMIVAYFLFMKIPFLYRLLGSRFEAMLSGVMGLSTDASTSFRLAMIQRGYGWFLFKPVFGYGLDCFKYLLGTNYTTWAGTAGVYSHNNYIELMVNLGLVGLILYYSLYAKLIYIFFKKKKRNKRFLVAFSLVVSLMVAEVGQVSYSIAFLQEIVLIAFFLIWLPKKV